MQWESAKNLTSSSGHLRLNPKLSQSLWTPTATFMTKIYSLIQRSFTFYSILSPFCLFFGIYMTNNISCYAVNCTFPKRLCTGFSEWILLFVHLLVSGTSALNLLSLSWSAADASGCKKTDFIEVYGKTALSSCSVTSVHTFLITLFVQLLVSYHIA